MNRISTVWLAALGAIVLVVSIPTARGGLIFQDDFESPVSSAYYWPETGDNDPTTPLVGSTWTVVEDAQFFVQEVRHGQFLPGDPYPKFNPALGFNTHPTIGPAPDGGNQYLHTILSFDVAGNLAQAWAPIAAGDQTQMASAGYLGLSTKLFALSGHDGWRGGVRIIGWDSAATVKTSPAFDLRFVDGGYGVNGTVIYRDGTGDHTVPGLVFKINEWHDVVLEANFSTDTFSITLDGVKVDGLTWAGGDLSQIQSVSLSPGNPPGFSSYRGGFDNFSLAIPEPAMGSLLTLGGLVLLGRRRTK